MMSKETWERLYEQKPVLPAKEHDEREQKRELERQRFDRNQHKMVERETGLPRYVGMDLARGEDETVKHAFDPCTMCNAMREGHVNLKSGNYIITIPTACQQKVRCERDLLRKMEVE